MRKMPKTKIAITGTIGSGKSSVAFYLRENGYNVFISDEYNAYLLAKGNEGYKDIVKNFDVLDELENIDKKKLANIVFNDSDKLNLLESITTNRIVFRIKELLDKDETDFFEIPLLFELGLEKLFDKVIVVTANDEIRINRLVNRGLDIDDAKSRIANQLNDEIKISKADFVIYNDGEFKDLHQEIDNILELIK